MGVRTFATGYEVRDDFGGAGYRTCHINIRYVCIGRLYVKASGYLPRGVVFSFLNICSHALYQFSMRHKLSVLLEGWHDD